MSSSGPDTTSTQIGTPLLRRRPLAEEAVSTATVRDVQQAVTSFSALTAPDAPRQDLWQGHHATTMQLITSAARVELSPAGHFLLVKARTNRGRKPLRWHVVHLRSGAHLPSLVRPIIQAHQYSDPDGASLDLSDDAVAHYTDAVERAQGIHGHPVDWDDTLAGVLTGLRAWRDPLLGSVHDPDHAEDHDSPDLAHPARELHTAAVLHALAANPMREAGTATVNDIVHLLSACRLPPVFGRHLNPLTGAVRRLLTDLNRGQRHRHDDQRTTEARREDADTTKTVILAALHLLGGHPEPAVSLLRHRVEHIRHARVERWKADRATDLERLVLLIGELFSPSRTEMQLLRHVTAGDVIASITLDSWRYSDVVLDQVMQVIGPIQMLSLGAGNGAESFCVPVTVRGTGAAHLIVENQTAPVITIRPLDGTGHRQLSPVAARRWAILHWSTALTVDPAMVHAASLRAAHAFDHSVGEPDPLTADPSRSASPTT